MDKIKILVWGIGRDYNRHLNVLKYWESQKIIEVVGLTDNRLPECHKIDGWALYEKEKACKIDVDYYVIMSEKYFLEIRRELLGLGIEQKKILASKILDIPYFDWEQYLKISNGGLSIICNNCVGGIIYNTLGLECLSPCKNLAIPDESFLKIIADLEHYMTCEPTFLRWQLDPHSKMEFPVMRLGDTEIWCNHDTVIQEAADKWNRRKEKINYQNILLIMYTESDEMGGRFLDTTQYKRILFVPEASSLEDEGVIKLRLFPGQEEFWEVVNSSASMSKNSCSYQLLDMLNGRRKYRSL